MLKDTTSEHRTHLFDLNCKICTGKYEAGGITIRSNSFLYSCFVFSPPGQKTEDEPAAKKSRLSKKLEAKPSKSGDVSPVSQPQIAASYQHQDSLPYQQPSYASTIEPTVVESQPQLFQDDVSMVVPPVQAPVPVVASVSSVSITRRDPRMARHSSGVTITYTAPEKPTSNSSEPLPAPLTAPVEVAPKIPLPMPPGPPSSVAVPKASKTRFKIS